MEKEEVPKMVTTESMASRVVVPWKGLEWGGWESEDELEEGSEKDGSMAGGSTSTAGGASSPSM